MGCGASSNDGKKSSAGGQSAFPIPDPFAWDPSFDVGNDEMNRQHQNIFAAIGVLEKDMQNGDKLKKLLDVVVLHFKTEEDAMFLHKYAEAPGHKAVHAKFASDAIAATAKGVNGETIAYLKSWLVTHVKACDMKYKGIF